MEVAAISRSAKFLRLSDEHMLLLKLLRHFLSLNQDSRAAEAALRTTAEQVAARLAAEGNRDTVQALIGALNGASRPLTQPPPDGPWYKLEGPALHRWCPQLAAYEQIPAGPLPHLSAQVRSAPD